MEDYARDVAPVGNGKREARRTKTNERLTIMIFKTFGRVWTVRVSAFILLGALFFLASYIVATIAMSYHYFDLLYATEMQTDSNDRLAEQLAAMRRSLGESHQQIALLKGRIEQQNAHTSIPEPASTMSLAGSPVPEVKEQSEQPLPTVANTGSLVPAGVEVTEVNAERQGSTVTVIFKIVNTQPQGDSLSGYIFVLTRVKGTDGSDMWVYPSCPLREGLPLHYKRGHRFSIRRFITIDTTYTLNRTEDQPLDLQILVYDKAGRLMVTKRAEA